MTPEADLWRQQAAQMQFEVEWYRQHGKHPRRLAETSAGIPYVIGDSAWNVTGNPTEIIEPQMARA
jgi:hypothetical protein